jgi:hypothetical protein
MNLIPSHSKQLSSDLKGKRLIIINLQHQLVYKIFEEEKMIKVLRFNCCFGIPSSTKLFSAKLKCLVFIKTFLFLTRISSTLLNSLL